MKRRRAGVLLLAACSIIGAATMATPAFALSPAVEVLPASSIGETGATLNGKVNPNGLETKYFFEYGTTTSYGSKTSEVSAGSGSGVVEKSQAISGLAKVTEYHYRMVASNSSGTSISADQTFKTATAPSVLTISATELEASGEAATLRGLLLANGSTTTYQFEFGTSSGSYTQSVPMPAASVEGSFSGTVSYKITGLTPGTKYFYRITATNSVGKAVAVNEASFVTPGKPEVSPSGANNPWWTETTVEATVEPHGLATSYYVEYGTTTSYGSKTATKELGAEVASSPASFTIGGLNPGTLYHYRWVATNAAGTKMSSDQTASTHATATLSFLGGTALKSNTVKAFSSFLLFSTHSCNEAELTGPTTTNPGARQEVSTVKFQSGASGCAFSSLNVKYKKGLNFKEIQALEYAIDPAKQVVVRTSPEFNIAATVYSGTVKLAECEYSLSLNGTAALETALETTLSGKVERIKGSNPCPESGTVSGTFTFTSEGNAITVKP